MGHRPAASRQGDQLGIGRAFGHDLAPTLGRDTLSSGLIGELIGGRYRVVRKISSGGMGIVCEGVHAVTGRKVALKIIRDVHGFGGEKESWLVRFKREARAAGSIDTPHIAQVFDASTDDATGQPFIAMELLSGKDLSSTLKELGPVPVDVALKIVAQACIGLERAHEAGVIHRDIKPGNLFLSEARSGEITVKLVDFGIAKVVDEPTHADGAELTQTGSLLGTPTYMSPEQAKGLRSIDVRSDIWALGVVLYKALSNTVPHPKREGLGQLIITICTEQAPSIQTRAPWVTPEVARILDKALRIDPEQRYQSAAEMRAEVETIIGPDRRLQTSMIRGLTDEERASVARRYDSAFPPPDPSVLAWAERSGHEGSSTQPGIVRVPEVPAARRGPWPWIATAALILSVGGAAWWWNGRTMPAPTPQVATSEPKSEPAAAVSAPARSVEVSVSPPNAEVSVDGTATALADGKLALTGKLGSTFAVRVAAEGQEKTYMVAIGEQGPVPAALTLPEKDPEPPVRAVGRRTAKPPGPTAKPTPDKPKPDKPKPRTGVGVVSDFE